MQDYLFPGNQLLVGEQKGQSTKATLSYLKEHIPKKN